MRLPRPFMALAIVLGVSVPVQQVFPSLLIAHVSAAGGQARLAIDAHLTSPTVVAGNRASLFVHSGALAQLTLHVSYAGGASGTYHGTGDSQGRYVFSWTVPLGVQLEGSASLALDARRGALNGAWSGSLTVQAAPLPPLFVQPVAARVLAGTQLGVFVSTFPRAPYTYSIVADGGVGIAQGAGQADAQGRAVIATTSTLLPRHTMGVTATVTVVGNTGTRTRAVHLTLLPRPALGLYVASTTRAAQAGTTTGVFISTAPLTHIDVTVALTGTVVARGSGTTDKYGRWVYTTDLEIPLQKATTAHVMVIASHGVDRAVRETSFLLKPGPLNLLRNAALDHLASSRNPSPDLSRYFMQVPEKVILVSTESQTLRAYEHGVLVRETYVTTGRPELPTVHGIFHVYNKVTPFQFISPWPAGSPYYYAPSWVRYWMPFFEGYGLHDSPWRSVYGPGTNLPHDSDPGEPVGSHGCVNIPLPAMTWLWNWAPTGTTVLIY